MLYTSPQARLLFPVGGVAGKRVRPARLHISIVWQKTGPRIPSKPVLYAHDIISSSTEVLKIPYKITQFCWHVVWSPDPSIKARTDTWGRVWANDLPFSVAEHCIPPWVLMRESHTLTSTCGWIPFYVRALPFIIFFITYVRPAPSARSFSPAYTN